MNAAQQADTEAYEMLRRYGSHSSAFLAMNSGNRRFHTDGVDGFVPYREAGRRHLFQLGRPVCAVEDGPSLLTALLARAGSERRGSPPSSSPARRPNCTPDTASSSTSSAPPSASRSTGRGGQRMVKVRNMVNRARREGVSVAEVPAAEERDGAKVTAALDAVDAAWLRAGASRNSSS